MEILMGNDAFNPLVIHIRGRLGAGKHILGVKDVKSLVLHGAHVKIIHRHNHVPVKIIFPAKFFLVPAHGLFQGCHGMAAFFPVALLHIDKQINFPARHGGEAVLQDNKISGNQGKKIGGLFERIMPAGKMAAIRQVALFHQVAV